MLVAFFILQDRNANVIDLSVDLPVFPLTHACVLGHNGPNPSDQPMPLKISHLSFGMGFAMLCRMHKRVFEPLKLERETVVVSSGKFAVYVCYFHFA